jgi:hypothetical protein
VILLRQLDDRLGLTGRMAALLGDDRDSSRVRHSRREQFRQRVYQICMGYEDCNDANGLRHDPAFQFACDSEGRPISSQPTLSRFENAITGRELNRLWREFERDYVDELEPATDLVVLDIDSTDDPTHGDQQLSFFHGFYDQHMFHPLLVFDALSGQLITALLRPGRAHAAKGAISILTRLIRAIRRRCPRTQILVRGDSAFAMPKLLDRLEELNDELGDVDYVIGVAKNSRLLDLAGPLRSSVAEQFNERRQFVRRFTWLAYASKSWPSERGVVCKVEHSSRGENPRFVVTTLNEFSPGLIYDVIRICDLFHYVQQRVAAESAAQRPVFKAELEENYPIALYRGGAAPRLVVPPATDAFDHDAFISYRRTDPADRAWVETVMVPRLEQLGLRLSLEHRDFRLAQPRIREMERAVVRSRYTVAVLTPAYLDGGFEDFQSLLSQHQSWETRVALYLPILRRPCRPSLGVRMASLLDLSSDPEVSAGLQRLALELRQPPRASYDA